ncbi:MAG: hypothetical protein HFJ34_01090 [Clostridia bacterium]|nr:hypothetical protein [Clostridia bacterium]
MKQFINNVKLTSSNNRTNKGITLIALVITIIVLLILAGISIATLTGDNGILNKAQQAEEKTTQAQIKELLQLAIIDIQTQIQTEQKRPANLDDITTETISEKIQDNLEITVGEKEENTNNTFQKIITITKNGETYQYKIKEDMTIEKIKDISSKKIYLYKEGNKYETITGGWEVTRQQNTSFDLDTYPYLHLNSYNDNYCTLALSSKNSILFDSIQSLNMKITIESNGYTNSNGGVMIGLQKSKINLGNWFNLEKNSGITGNQTGENIILNLDTKEITGEYFVGLQLGRYLVKVHEIWLETSPVK